MPQIIEPPTMSGEISAPALSTHQDDSTFEFHKVAVQDKLRHHLNLSDGENYVQRVNEYYSIDEIAEFLRGNDPNISPGNRHFKRITLQFPDSLICDSATIVHELQKKLGLTYDASVVKENKVFEERHGSCSNTTSREPCCSDKDSSLPSCSNNEASGCCSSPSAPTDITSQRIWILADTSYSACCIDEVAAEHVHSDLVIHFGDACLNPVDKLPALYVFGKPRVHLDILIEQFEKHYSDKSDKVLLMADAPHTTILKSLYDQLKPLYPNLAYADLYTDPESQSTIVGYKPDTSEHDNVHVLNRTLLHLNDNDMDMDEIDSTLCDFHLFHITVPEAPRLLQLTTRFSSVVTYDPIAETISQGPFPNLMRRYRYMHMARAAGTVGLLVNTLSLANTKKLINNMGKKLKEAGKKHYIFVVGKPNVAKLANFENVDIWCILGCDHQGIIIDQHNEYFKPIVTPYELMLALNYELSWTGRWVTDFRNILADLDLDNEVDENEDDKPPVTSDDDYEDEAPEFNPVTGQYASESRPLRRLQHLQITSQEESPSDQTESENSLVKKFSSTIAIKNTVSTSAIHLQNRHWTGLGSDWRNDDSDEEVSQKGAKVEEGRGGIARGYDYDREIHH